MSIKIGDKVRFLNSVGGGIVMRFINKEIVGVEEEDGFETPILIRECVIIEGVAEAKLKEAKENIPQPIIPPTAKTEERLFVKETLDGDKINLLLAYLPVNIKQLSSTSFETYMVNDSNYRVTFIYLSKSIDKWKMRFAGTVEPHQHLFIEEFEIEALNSLEKIAIQYMPYKSNKPFEMKPTGAVELRLDGTKFFKLHAFRENDYFEDEAIILPVVVKDRPQSFNPTEQVDTQQLAAAMKEKEQNLRPERVRKPHKSEDPNKPVEVDLHIHELVDTTAGLDNAAMLELQTDKVKEVMAQYRKEKGRRIVFIHGKGEGVLRNEVLKILRRDYPTYQTQDASFKEYGFGATMVIVK